MLREFASELLVRLEEYSPFIQVVLGPRQVGKTTGVLALEKLWKGPFSYASADSPSPPNAGWIQEQWQNARLKGPHGLLALDEIQKILGWSEVVKRLFDEERRRGAPLRVVILGSASWIVQQGLSESLLGRFEVLPASHWTFAECREAFEWGIDDYMKYGGYPAPSVLTKDVERWQQFMRDSIIEPMVARDLSMLRTVAKPALLRQTLELVLRHPAQEISLQKLLGQLQDRGNSTTIKGYLELLEAGFVIKVLSKFASRPLTTKNSSPKLVPLCGALMHTFETPHRIDTDPVWRGRVYEALIGAELIKAFPKVYYWRDGNREVDYVIEHHSRIYAIEVKSGVVSGTHHNSYAGLEAFKKQFPSATTITLTSELGLKLLNAANTHDFLNELVNI
jgi:uncharacterized protein